MTGISAIEANWKRRCQNLLKDMPDYVSEFYQSQLVRGRKSPNTMFSYLKVVRKFLFFVGDKSLSEIQERDIDGFIISISDDPRGKLSMKSLCLSALDTFFKWAVRYKYISTSPVDGIEKIRMPKKDHAVRTDALTADELQILTGNVLDGVSELDLSENRKWMRARDIAVVFLLVETGIRIEPLIKLDINDIDFENGILHTHNKEDLYMDIELSRDLLKKLSDWIGFRQTVQAQDNALFLSQQGNRMTYNSYLKLIRKYSDGINKPVTPHKLRATYASLLSEAGMSLDDISLLMGHASVNTTRVYIRNKQRRSKEAANMMADIIGR